MLAQAHKFMNETIAKMVGTTGTQNQFRTGNALAVLLAYVVIGVFTEDERKYYMNRIEALENH